MDSPKPLLASKEEMNELTLLPGKLYRFNQYSSRYAPWKLHKFPGSGDLEPLAGIIPFNTPFFFVSLEVMGNRGFSDSGSGRWCWLRVIHGDIVGFICVCTTGLHYYLEEVTPDE